MNVIGTKIEAKKKGIEVSVRKEILSCFNGLLFEEESHTYTLKSKTLLSVTTSLHEFTEPFQQYVISSAMGRNAESTELGKTRDKDYYIRRWRFIREQASNSGSRVHEYLEYNYPDFKEMPRCKQEEGGKSFLLGLDPKYKVLFAELKMYDEEWGLAGTIDLLLYNTKTGNLVIADWKTNDTNITQVYNHKTLKKPFTNLYAHDLNKYSLQLSLYKAILERNTNFKVEEMWIMHLSTNPRLELDYGKRHKVDKYHVEDVTPMIEYDGCRVYKTDDKSDKLTDYFNFRHE